MFTEEEKWFIFPGRIFWEFIQERKSTLFLYMGLAKEAKVFMAQRCLELALLLIGSRVWVTRHNPTHAPNLLAGTIFTLVFSVCSIILLLYFSRLYCPGAVTSEYFCHLSSLSSNFRVHPPPHPATRRYVKHNREACLSHIFCNFNTLNLCFQFNIIQ